MGYLSKGYKYDHCDFRIALLSRKTANSCTCDDCSLDTCICTNSSSAYSASVKDTYLFDRFNVRYTGFEINECHENCSCQPHTCPNRMIGLYDELDRWKIQKKIKIEITDRYGWALIAAEYFERRIYRSVCRRANTQRRSNFRPDRIWSRIRNHNHSTDHVAVQYGHTWIRLSHQCRALW